MDLGLVNGNKRTWEMFIKDLKVSHIPLSDNEDSIIQEKHINGGIYTPNWVIMQSRKKSTKGCFSGIISYGDFIYH